MNDLDEYVRRQTDVLARMSDVELSEFKTKRQYIEELKEATKPLIQAGYYEDVEMPDFCSFIAGLLEKNNISYPRTKLPELFADDEKRIKHSKNFTKGEVEHSSPPDEGIEGVISQLTKAMSKSYDDGYECTTMLDRQTRILSKLESHYNTIRKRLQTARYFIDYFEKRYTVEEFEKLITSYPRKTRERLEAILTSYHAAVLYRSEIETAVVENYDDSNLRELEAAQDITSKRLDERRILSSFEKITIYLAMRLDKIAKNHVANLHGIDKKHVSNNIVPTHNPVLGTENRHHRILEKLWFRTMRVVCAKCHHENVFDAAEKIEEDLSRDKLDLNVHPTVLVNAEVE